MMLPKQGCRAWGTRWIWCGRCPFPGPWLRRWVPSLPIFTRERGEGGDEMFEERRVMLR